MTALMRRLAEGDHELVIAGAGRGDEIGTMAKAVEVFRQSMIDAKQLRAEREELKRQAEVERRAAMLQLADGLEGSVKEVVETLSRAAGQMEGSARTMSATAESATRRLGPGWMPAPLCAHTKSRGIVSSKSRTPASVPFS